VIVAFLWLIGILAERTVTRGVGPMVPELEPTIALDDLTLYSEALTLVGRPDRIAKIHGVPIPEDWKASS
jgi:hypothetical protein